MRVALDSSAAVPYVVAAHAAHQRLRARLAGTTPVLTTHSLAETYSVLTRLPGDARLTPVDATRLLGAAFPLDAVPLASERAIRIPEVLAPLGFAGGAVYDALVALAAADAGLLLVTRDRRASATYIALAARVEMVP